MPTTVRRPRLQCSNECAELRAAAGTPTSTPPVVRRANNQRLLARCVWRRLHTNVFEFLLPIFRRLAVLLSKLLEDVLHERRCPLPHLVCLEWHRRVVGPPQECFARLCARGRATGSLGERSHQQAASSTQPTTGAEGRCTRRRTLFTWPLTVGMSKAPSSSSSAMAAYRRVVQLAVRRSVKRALPEARMSLRSILYQSGTRRIDHEA